MRANSCLRHLLSLALALCMVLALSLSAFAVEGHPESGNASVQNDKQGVLQVRLGFKIKDSNNVQEIQAGTGFLINPDYMVTCYHVVNFDMLKDEDWKTIKDEYGMSRKQVEDKKQISVSVYRDMSIKATIVHQSAKVDLAILKLDQPLQNKTFLKINDAPVETTAPCYTLGFPGLIELVGDLSTYTSDDVTVTGGIINKLHQVGTVSFICYSDNMTQGGSGGPVVNYAGDVIGIHDGSVSGDGFDKEFRYAVDVKELRAMLDPLGIEYTPSAGDDPDKNVTVEEKKEDETPVPEPDPEPVVDKSALNSAITAANSATKDGHGKAEVADFENALTKAQEVQAKADATKEEVEAASKDLIEKQQIMIDSSSGSGIPIPAIIAIVAAAIILIIILVMVMGNRNKPAPSYGSGPSTIPPFEGGGAPVGGGYAGGPAPFSGGDPYAGKEGTTVLGGGASDTTVLGGNSNATTVLSGNYGYLTRTKTGERITITKEQFKVGRERSRVDMCISDNTAVGRLHAIIVSRGGSSYVVDQNSTNCTFVNSQRASANQEVPLKNGDKVTFADEEYTFNAF